MEGVSQKIGALKVWYHAAPSSKGEVIHIHGLGEHSARHHYTFTALINAGYSVVRFDLRGCGESEGERQWIQRFEDYAEDATQVIEWARGRAGKANIPRFLMGHSLGGAIAIHTLSRGERGLRGLVMSAPAYRPGGGVSGVKIAVGKMLSRVLPHLKIPGTLDLSMLSRDLQVAEAYRRDPLNCTYNRARQGVEILRAMEELPERCKLIRIPAWIAHGTEDQIIRYEGSRELIPYFSSEDKMLQEFPGGYHELHNDTCRAEYFSKLIGWLEKHR